MMRTILRCSVSALTLCVSNVAAIAKTSALVTHARGEVHRVIAGAPGSVTLYDQNNDDASVAVISSDFDDFDSFSSYGADDFMVPVGHKWRIREVEVSGIYEAGDGPAPSENILFYKDKNGLPGDPVAQCPKLIGHDNHGSFAIKFPKSCRVSLKGGKRYWISVVANMDFSCCGQWAWQTRNTQNGAPAVWENPNDGFGTGCRTWNVIASCLGNNGQGPDFMFTLKGKDVLL